jgi:lysophospholipase L1-like esterase
VQDAAPAPAPAGGSDTNGEHAGVALRIEPNEYDGLKQFIEHPEALAAFFAKLARTAQREAGAITRVAHYGDSAVAADAITSTARRRMQARFGDAGHGFILLAHGDMHYIHKDAQYRSSDGWEIMSIVQDPLRPGFYGYGGIQIRGKNGEHATVGTAYDGLLGKKVARFELFYQRFRGGGPIEIRVDGDKLRTLKTNSTQPEDAYEVVDVPDGEHLFSVRALGSEAHMFGVAMERSEPGVVYDSLGLVGARAERLLNAEPDHIRAQLAHRDADLLVLNFGGNEAGNQWLNLQQYEHDLTSVVRLMRSGKPAMSCLLLGPIDQAERNERGQIVTLATLPQVVEVQRRVAAQEKCAFFDAFAAMGGSGSMSAWLKTHPKLATSDLRHATPAGYDVIGIAYYKAVLKAFAEYLAGGGRS